MDPLSPAETGTISTHEIGVRKTRLRPDPANRFR